MINDIKEMIVLKGVTKTLSVQSCEYNPKTKKYDVTFTGGKIFTYAYDNVEIIYQSTSIDISEYRLQKQAVN